MPVLANSARQSTDGSNDGLPPPGMGHDGGHVANAVIGNTSDAITKRRVTRVCVIAIPPREYATDGLPPGRRKLQCTWRAPISESARREPKGRHSMQIARDTVVSIDYTLTNDAGEVLDTSRGSEPLSYIHGRGQLVPGLEGALSGRTAGDAFTIRI